MDKKIERGKRTYFVLEKRKKTFMNKRNSSDSRGDEWDYFDKIYDGLLCTISGKRALIFTLENKRNNLCKLDFNFE